MKVGRQPGVVPHTCNEAEARALRLETNSSNSVTCLKNKKQKTQYKDHELNPPVILKN